nr:CIDEA (del 71-160 aa)-3XHA [synthetic construct]
MGLVTLVLEEDGTVVDTEEFFQTLGDNTHFMILEKGQKWMPGSQHVPTCSPPKRSGIARVTFDLYRLNPKDFIGCLNVKATMYEMYSVSYYPYDVPDYAGYPYDVPDYAGSYPYDVPDYA